MYKITIRGADGTIKAEYAAKDYNLLPDENELRKIKVAGENGEEKIISVPGMSKIEIDKI